MTQSKRGLSAVRTYLWPIYGQEHVKFLPLFCMAFFIGFNYSILRTMKDTMLVTAEDSGAEVLPFIKVWGIIPAALLITLIYGKLNNRLHRDRVFYSMIGLFMGFFAIFTFFLYPIRDYLHPHETADWLQSILPPGFKGLIAMFRYWLFSSFYIMSDLWSSTILSMLFWGVANEVTQVGEAKRFYGLIAIGLNIASVSSGQVSFFLSTNTIDTSLFYRDNPWEQTLIFLTLVVLFCGAMIMGIYRYLSRKLETTQVHISPQSRFKESPKIHMSMKENFIYLWRSKYLLYIAVIVLSYNLIINLVEVIWKDQVKQLYPSPNEFNAYMSQISSLTGLISMFTALLISGHLIRRCGWTITALAPPIILLITSIGFFFFFFGRNDLLGVLTFFGTSPLALVVFFGSAQNCLSRAAKFALFDATKEIAFVPLSSEAKLKGKALIDGVGSRLGKSGGSLLHQALLLIFATISASAHIVAIMLFIVITVWISAVLALGKQFNALVGQPQTEPALGEELKGTTNTAEPAVVSQ